ncbi:MAG: LacI family DNA-binding transcriptional regulator, partial [Rhizobium leguminosarum]
MKLSDVAKKVGVSPITISRALRNPEIVSEDLRQTILRTVDEMGYIPNLAARALAGRHNGIIGVITPALHHHGFAGLMIGIEDCLRTT